jgi:hypothetical protein
MLHHEEEARWPIWFFLARRRFAAKIPAKGYWISLDFLGFSRPKRDFSVGSTDFCIEILSCALFPYVRDVGLEASGRAVEETQSLMRAA